MPSTILLVDDQRDILRLLHSSLDTLKNKDLKIIEAPSGEEAMLAAGRQQVDLLVADYLLPGMTGVELMHKIRAKHPEVKVILVSGNSDRKARDEMLNAGAVALFDKPISLADFLDAVERNLGLARTILPSDSDKKAETRRSRLSDLLANFRQDINAQAVFLLNERGLVLARAGDLHDSSMEVSLLSALTSIFNAGLKVSRFIRQDSPDQYHVFSGGDHDLLLIPVTALYSLLLAGNGLASRENILDTVQAMLALRTEVEKSLKSLGVTSELKEEPASPPPPAAPVKKKGKTGEIPAGQPAPEIEAMLKDAGKQKSKPEEVDDFWSKAAEQHGTKTTNPDVISYEEARKQGLIPGEEKK
jgi:CheY-like chemotaxis protein